MIKLIASDYDHTLFHDKPLDGELISKIKEFRAKGNKFAIVTGRHVGAIFDEAKVQGIEFDFIVGSNGGMIVDAERNILYRKFINPEIIKELMAISEVEEVAMLNCTNGDDVSLYFKNDEVRNHFEKRFTQYFRHSKIISKEEMLNSAGIISFVATGLNPEQTAEAQRKVVERFGNDIDSFKNLVVFDIVAKGTSKANGIKEALKHFTFDEVHAIGDDFNDISMVTEFNGYCMANGIDELKAIAKKQYVSVKDLIDDIM